MDDEKIIKLFFDRDENAISAVSAKYGRLCRHIASGILASSEDCQECVSDTFMALWRSIPPQHPVNLAAFIGKTARNLALKRYEYISAEKRNPNAVCSFEELSDSVSGSDTPENAAEAQIISDSVSKFLRKQSKTKRGIFICRYWYFDSIETICRKTGFSQSKVTSTLYNMRKKLREHLESEGIEI